MFFSTFSLISWGIKFRRFRGFRKNCEIKYRRKICNWAIREIKFSRKFLKNKTNPQNFHIFFKQTYIYCIQSLYSIQMMSSFLFLPSSTALDNFSNVKYHCCFMLLISTSCFKYTALLICKICAKYTRNSQNISKWSVREINPHEI